MSNSTPHIDKLEENSNSNVSDDSESSQNNIPSNLSENEHDSRINSYKFSKFFKFNSEKF